MKLTIHVEDVGRVGILSPELVRKIKTSYDRMDFQHVIINDEWKKIDKTWQEKVQEECLAFKPKKLLK